ncbi:hypothetical protein NCS52_00387000 [Fusarium sp. LHS14.1]|nr:hypothetical protein NCS52_00387000 [Fusarium sp. LHS14.1]
MGYNNDNRGGYNGRGRNRRGWNKAGRNNGWQNDGNQQNGNNQHNGNNQQNQQNGNNQQNSWKKQNQQNQWKHQNQHNQHNQHNQQNQQNYSNDDNDNGKQDDQDSINDNIDWNKNGWVGGNDNTTTNNNNNDSNGQNSNNGNGNRKNRNHCCFWQKVSQDPYLRQVYGLLSQFLVKNKNPLWSVTPPTSVNVIMAEATQAKTAWQQKVASTQGATVLLSTGVGSVIGQALYGYFEPCMNPDILDETYMIIVQDVDAPASQCVGKYTVHSRSPFFPNGPKDLYIQIQVKEQAKEVEMLVSPCNTDGFNFEGPVGAMKPYRKSIATPINGYTFAGQIDGGVNGLYLSLMMGQTERAWEYIYSHLIKCPQ